MSTLERVREKYGISGNCPLVLFVGTLMPRKGVTELVEALGRLVDEGAGATVQPEMDEGLVTAPQPQVGEEPVTAPQPQVHGGPVVSSQSTVDGAIPTPQVILAGASELDGEYVSKIKTLLSDASLEEEVQMPGFVPTEDLPALYTLADVFVMPSLEEGFGMCVVEAMAAGTPVVASRTGAMPRIVEDGRNGRLVDVGDVDGLAVALGELLSSSQLRDRTGEQAQYRAGDFPWIGIAEQFVLLYTEVGRD